MTWGQTQSQRKLHLTHNQTSTEHIILLYPGSQSAAETSQPRCHIVTIHSSRKWSSVVDLPQKKKGDPTLSLLHLAILQRRMVAQPQRQPGIHTLHVIPHPNSTRPSCIKPGFFSAPAVDIDM